VLTLCNARVRRGPQILLDEATATIFRGEKIGIVGRNGCGKSTLLALIRGELTPDAGEYSAPPDLAIGWVAQELPDSDRPLLEYILDGDVELRAVEAQLARAHERGEGVLEASLHARYEALGGYAARSRAAQLAAGLGFDSADPGRALREFSGGLRMRANLARALMHRSELLLLDEPTNHLDLDALLWLEEWLRDYRGTLLLVSHDREFLDAIVGRILYIEGGRLHAYPGNYSAFETQHAAHAERTRALVAKRRREAAHIQSFVERFRAKASKARQVQSRLKWLARLESIAAVHTESGFEWEFAPPVKLPRPLVALALVDTGRVAPSFFSAPRNCSTRAAGISAKSNKPFSSLTFFTAEPPDCFAAAITFFPMASRCLAGASILISSTSRVGTGNAAAAALSKAWANSFRFCSSVGCARFFFSKNPIA